MLVHFSDAENGGFFDTSDDHEALLHRPKEIQDNATPSANAMAAHVLLQLSLLGGEMTYWERAETTVAALEEVMGRYPTGFAHWLCAATFILGEPREVAIAGALDDDRTQALLKAVSEPYFPHLVRAAGENGRTVPLLADRPLRDGQPTAYVCRRFLCEQPVITPEALAGQLRTT